MISSQILQNSIDGMKNISRMDLCVTDTEGKVVATTTSFQTNYTRAVEEFVKSPADSQEIQSNQFFKIYDEQQLEYIVICSGVGENTYVVGKMAAFQIQSLVVAYKERFDKDNFVKNLLLDNLLLVDIYGRAKRLRIQTDVRRVCLIVENDNGKYYLRNYRSVCCIPRSWCLVISFAEDNTTVYLYSNDSNKSKMENIMEI